MSTKKLIAFNDEQIEKIEALTKNPERSFTEVVRELVDIGLKHVKTKAPETTNTEEKAPEIVVQLDDDRVKNIEKQIESLSWWNAEDTESKISQMESQLNKLQKDLEDHEKRINVLTAAAKQSKAHVKDRELHLMD